ncbi:RagB/SusD family nutrient uptake outer membrane protein [Mucilaginibacter daejeonensis]|uniref:RagB/SusD family nutrient uptake outer membrane protein n=1 Tax=Mucilaginibacter daejeonensis TaxID=398049 RepID=UPI001D176CAA|nr:RagB/SusD family nutrient uptake outer membrane protein [Mucilaginibacter daejeonensis]UEG52850.1 RagB/SusD family nutrient uptake outer membrane protein [Mucilaginibacter daejeonensis]
MKRTSLYIIAAFGVAISASSCKKVLEKQDLGNFTAAQVYNDSVTAKLSVDYLYTQNQPVWFGNTGGSISSSISTLSDEQYSNNAFTSGSLTIASVTDIGVANSNGNNYGKIRFINMFLRDINAGTLAPAVKRRFAAQAYFWRAYRYFELMRIYGGVPLVSAPLDAVGDEAKKAALLPRSSAAATLALIKSDLDSCVRYLPGKWPNANDYGRVTSGAAAAFLGRVLVEYASPLFNPNNDQTRWQAAYDANLNAVNILKANGFGLYNKFDYTMWTNEKNSEQVLATQFNTDQTDNGRASNTYTNNTIPRSLSTGSGSNQPTWDMARAFPMKDGKDTLTSKYPYSQQTFYKNRDPRFDQTIAYNGALWPLLGNSNYRVWTYYYPNNKSNASQLQTTEPVAASSTGLYLRKAIDPGITADKLQFGGTDWLEIRYAEVLLNLGEAAAELGRLGTGDEAYAGIIALRQRAGIEAGDGLYGLTAGMTKAQMITAIMKERQIEFAFEGKRFWDLRRRKLLISTLNGRRRLGVVFALNNNTTYTDYIASTRDASANTNFDTFYATNFRVLTKFMDTTPIAYQTAAEYFYGLPIGALNNNVNLQQTVGWGGTFDPLQ